MLCCSAAARSARPGRFHVLRVELQFGSRLRVLRCRDRWVRSRSLLLLLLQVCSAGPAVEWILWCL